MAKSKFNKNEVHRIVFRIFDYGDNYFYITWSLVNHFRIRSYKLEKTEFNTHRLDQHIMKYNYSWLDPISDPVVPGSWFQEYYR